MKLSRLFFVITVLALLLAGCSSGTGAYDVGSVTLVSASDVWSPWEVDAIQRNDPEGHMPLKLEGEFRIFPTTQGWVDVSIEEWGSETFHTSQLDLLTDVANRLKEFEGVAAHISVVNPQKAVLRIELPKDIGDNYVILRRNKRLRIEAEVVLTRPDGSDDVVPVVFHSPCAGEHGGYQLEQEFAVFRLESFDQVVAIDDVLNGMEIFSVSGQIDVDLAVANSLSPYRGRPSEDEVDAFSFESVNRSREQVLRLRSRR